VKTWRFLIMYLLCIIMSNAFIVLVLFIQAGMYPHYFKKSLLEFHSIGASGAVAGLMGLFAVRCFFARLKLMVPVFLLPWLSTPLPLQAAVVIALFFTLDLYGGLRQMETYTQTNYWAHVGGYLGGLILGYSTGLYREAFVERLEARAERGVGSELGKKTALQYHRDSVEKDPDDLKAHEYLFKTTKRSNPEKASLHYAKLLELYSKQNFKLAQKLFDENYPNYMHAVSGGVLVRLGKYYLDALELEKARHCYQLASQNQGPWQMNALFNYGKVMAILGRKDAAKAIFDQVLKKDSSSIIKKEVERLLKE
jgi:tetratricopeptide (TPR) repeat protein